MPASDRAIDDVAVTSGTVWVVDLDGGPQQVRRFDTSGGALAPVDIPPVSSVSSFGARLTRLRSNLVAWRGASYTDAGTWWVSGDGGDPDPDGPPDDHLGRTSPSTS